MQLRLYFVTSGHHNENDSNVAVFQASATK